MSARPSATLVLLVLLGLPAAMPALAQEATSPPYAIDDAAGDQATLLGLGPMVPSTPLTLHADLRQVRIQDEDEFGFSLVYKMGALDVSYSGQILCCPEQVQFSTTFKLASSPLEYVLDVFVGGAFEKADTSSLFIAGYVDGSLCLPTDDGSCFRQPVYPWIDAEADELYVWIPKASLLGRLDFFGFSSFDDVVARPAGTPTTFHSGERLTGLRVEVTYIPAIILLPAAVEDAAPDAGDAPDYVFQRPLANQVIRLSMARSFQLAVEAGANQTIPFTLENLAAGKRLVQMEYELQGPDEAVKLYRASGPATVTVPGGQTRNFSLTIDAKPTASPADGVYLLLRGTSVNDPEEVAFTSRLLVAGGVLGPGSNVLYMHSQHFGPGAPLDAAFCSLPFTFCDMGFISPLKDHPYGTPGRVRGFGYTYTPDGGIETVFAGADIELSSPIAFDLEKPIEMDLNLASGVPGGAVEVDVVLQYWAPEDSGTLFEGTGTGNTAAGSPPVTVSGPVRLGAAEGQRPVLPAGTWLQLIVEITYPHGSVATVDWAQGGSGLLTEGTQIRLPLVEVPEDLRAAVVDAPVQIGSAEDTEDFVNPGEARLFNVSVLNQADADLRVSLAADIDRPGWTVDIVPGRVFELTSGDTILLGILVHASPNATEGDVALVRLNATAEGFPNPASLVLRALVTEFDLPDDAGAFTANEEDAAKIVSHESKDTPAPAAVLLLPVLAGAVWIRRRRA